MPFMQAWQIGVMNKYLSCTPVLIADALMQVWQEEPD